MSGWQSALYLGSVIHNRMRPRRHTLRYRAFWSLLDLDELCRLSGALRLFSHNRFGLFSFYDRDHGDGTNTSLRSQVEAQLRQGGIDAEGGPIRLLCMPRILGYVFNPISIYFCYRPDGGLAATLYEVNNTFGQRHSYLLPVDATQAVDGQVTQSCCKRLYVSPFMDMDMGYEFRVHPPDRTVALAVDVLDGNGLILATALRGNRRAFDDGVLLLTFFSYPLLTLKIIGAIHWEALRLWLKGMRIKKRPPKPASPLSIGRDN
jgi:DUF1365 family protein